MYHGCKINRKVRQAIFGQMERMPSKGGKTGETITFISFAKSG
jgi:hypothetical protein